MGQINHPKEGRPSASVHSLCRYRARHDSQSAWLAIRVDNAHLIAAAYGDDILEHALSSLQYLLADAIKADGDSVAMLSPGGSVEAFICNPSVLFGVGGDWDECSHWLDDFCETVALIPFETPLGGIHLSLTAQWGAAGRDGSPALRQDQAGLLTHRHAICGPDWIQQYRSDMALASRLFAQMSCEENGHGHDRLCLAWQPICASSERNSVLYHEALLRRLDHRGELQSVEDATLACERLGLARYLDRHVVRLVLDCLDRPGVVGLGVNISAQSLRLDPWWSGVLKELTLQPEKARRFIVEITETTPIPDMAQAVELVSQLRRLGCWVALDDFGAGYTSFRHAVALTPDIIKIDGLFLRRAAQGGTLGAAFGHLVGLADALGKVLIVAEGVESAEDARIAEEAGASWHQGYLYGRPTLSNFWPKHTDTPSPATGDTGSDRHDPAQTPTSFLRNLGSSIRRKFIVADCDPAMPHEETADEGRLGKGILVAIPASLLLWWGIFAAAAAL